MVDYYREIARTDFRAELQRLGVPVTIIQENGDVSAPAGLCGQRMAALLPKAE